MQRIDSQGAVNAPDATEALGAIVGYFTEGSPQTATPATVVSADWANSVQEEILAPILDQGIVPDKTNRAQLLEAIKSLIENAQATTPFVLANNQIAAASITGLVFDKTKFTSAEIVYELYRKDATPTENKCIGKLIAIYKPVLDTWTLLGPNEQGDDCGVVFSITNAGQIQYTSSNYAGGTYVGSLKTKVTRFKA